MSNNEIRTSKCVSPHAHDIVTITGQGAQEPLQQKKLHANVINL